MMERGPSVIPQRCIFSKAPNNHFEADGLSPMNAEITKLVAEAKQWLATQGTPEIDSPKWYALGNFRSFISTLETDLSAHSIAKAVHSLRHHITDQYEWSAEHCKTISGFASVQTKLAKARLAANTPVNPPPNSCAFGSPPRAGYFQR